MTTAPGWKEAYDGWRKGPRNGLTAPAKWGGQDLPHVLNAACVEMWNAASMAFAVGPLVGMSAIDAFTMHGSEELKASTCPSWFPASGSRPCSLPSRRPARTSGVTHRRRARPAAPIVSKDKNIHHLWRARPPKTLFTSCSRGCPTPRPARAAFPVSGAKIFDQCHAAWRS